MNHAGSAEMDRQALEELRAIMGAKFDSMLRLYVKDTDARLTDMGGLLQTGTDMDRLSLMAHSVKSSSAQIGATALAAVASELEQATTAKRPSAELAALLERLRALFAETRTALQALAEL